MGDFLDDIKKIHGPYLRKDGRRHVVIVYLDGHKRTVSYPKFLAEFVMGRPLDPNMETVDHVDDDFTNNSWGNIRIVPRTKHTSDAHLIIEDVVIKCIWCGALAKKNPRNLNHNAVQGRAGPFCSRKCSGVYSTEVQYGRYVPFPVQNTFPVEKRSYVKRSKRGGIRLSYLVDTSIREKDILQYCSKNLVTVC